MEYVPLLAPIAAFLVIMLFGAGFYRTANHGGLIARKRLAAFTPAGTSAGSAMALPALEMNPLLKRRKFSSIASLDQLLQRREFGARISLELARGALPLRVGEYLLLRWLI